MTFAPLHRLARSCVSFERERVRRGRLVRVDRAPAACSRPACTIGGDRARARPARAPSLPRANAGGGGARLERSAAAKIGAGDEQRLAADEPAQQPRGRPRSGRRARDEAAASCAAG